MITARTFLTAVSAVAVLIAPQAGVAQKSKDLLRYAVTEPFRTMEPYVYTANEAAPFYRQIYQGLVGHDEYKRAFVPMLAKSWKRVSPTVIELELRDDVKFHNGNPFTADDVVYTYKYAADPKIKLRFKGRYTWLKDAEKLGPYKVRISSKKIFPMDLLHMANRGYIMDAETHAPYEDKGEYGRQTPVGTGAYKVVSIDRNKGTLVERYDGVKGIARAPISKVHAVYLTDPQTQVSELLVGNIDVIRNVKKDVAAGLKGNPSLKVTAVDSLTIGFMLLDAAGRSGKKELTDPRVRKALMMAVDRDALIKGVIPGGEVATKTDGYCFKIMRGCDWSTNAVGYDPAAAKKLLAEAGYPDGFDLQVSTHVVLRDLGQAVAGELRKIGIRASVQTLTTPALRKARGGGKLQAFVHYYPQGSFPDTAGTLQMYFAANRDYAKDDFIHDMMTKGLGTHDLAARTGFYRQAMDRINEKFYMLPISSLPITYAFSKHVRIEPNQLYAKDVHISDFFWN